VALVTGRGEATGLPLRADGDIGSQYILTSSVGVGAGWKKRGGRGAVDGMRHLDILAIDGTSGCSREFFLAKVVY